MSAPGSQTRVDRYFDDVAAFWREVYDEPGLQSLVYRERMQAALGWVEELGLPPGAAVLDAGCGAGLMTLALAQRDLTVSACDSSGEMVERLRARLAAQGAGGVTVLQADAHTLPFPSGSFNVVVALGLLPWLHDPAQAVREMARVLASGGWLILTADNALRLNMLTEPAENPVAAPLRVVRRHLRRGGGRGRGLGRGRGRGPELGPELGPERPEPDHIPPHHRHTPAQVRAMLSGAGLDLMRQTTIGFGPFTAMYHPLLSDSAGIRLHRRLDAAAQRHPRLRRHGWHYLALARKS